MIRAYLRISTETQDEASQRAIIREWAANTSRSVDQFYADAASGGTPWESRAIAGILADSRPGDSIVVSEISRIARSILGVLSFLQAAAAAEVEVIAIRSGIKLDNSLSSKIVVTILALAAEVERDLIRERTKAALAARRAAGMTLGRPRGARSVSVLHPKRAEIAKLLQAGVAKRALARLLGCSPTTLYAYLASEAFATGDERTLSLPLENRSTDDDTKGA